MENAFLVVRLRQWDNIQIFYLKRFLIYHWFCKFLAWTIIVITTKVLNETFSLHEEMLTRFLNKKGFNSIMLKFINTIHNFFNKIIFLLYILNPLKFCSIMLYDYIIIDTMIQISKKGNEILPQIRPRSKDINIIYK